MSIVSPAESFVILGKCAKWVSSEHGVGTTVGRGIFGEADSAVRTGRIMMGFVPGWL